MNSRLKEIKIPDSLIINNHFAVNLFDYRSSENSTKQCINLTTNAFSFLIEGKKEIFTSNTYLSIKNTNFLLMKSGHCLMTETLSPMKKNYRSMLLFFSNEAILNFIRKFGITPFEPCLKQSVHTFQYDAFIKNFVQSIMEISTLPTKSQQQLTTVKFEEIMLYLVETKGSDFLYAILNDTNQQSQRLKSVVETNKYNRLSLKELAFLSNMSISSFKREFVKHYAQSPIKWFQDQRLEYASLLLKQAQKRPSDIYLDVGYENLSSFIQAFKSKYGVTPKQYQ